MAAEPAPRPTITNFEIGRGEELLMPDRDAVAFRLPLFRGADRVAGINVAMAGIDLAASAIDTTDRDRLMWALARASLLHVAALITMRRLPRSDDAVFEIRPDYAEVVAAIGSPPPTKGRLAVPEPVLAAWLDESRSLGRVSFDGLFGFASPQTFEVGGLNVIIGENGSGKTSVAEVLGALAALGAGLDLFAENPNWMHAGPSLFPIFPLTLSKPVRPMIELELNGDPAVRYRVDLAPDRRGSPTFGEERMTAASNDLLRVPGRGFAMEFRQRAFTPTGDSLAVIAGPLDSGAALQLLRSWAFYPEADLLCTLLTRIRIYGAWRLADRSPIDRGIPASTTGSWLHEGGTNLAAVLRTREQTGTIPTFDEWFRRVMRGEPRLRGVEDGEKLRLVYEHNRRKLSASALSDGSLRWAQLICALQGDASLVVLDEPELGLHPDLIDSLGELLVESSKYVSIVVLTHSPALLDALDKREMAGGLLVAEQESEGNHLFVPDLEAIRKDWPPEAHSLSELWARGLLGGNRW